jgi:hypothetical protein
VSLGIPFHLKKKLGVVASFREQIFKNHCAKIWTEKNKNRPVSGFFTKITYVQVMNFIQKQYHKTSHFSENFDFMTKSLLLGNNHEIR